MPLQKLPVTGLDDENHRRRAREVTNQILDHSFDDSRVQTPAEVAAGVTPVNKAFPPGDIRRFGAAKGATDAENRVALQKAIAVVSGEGSTSGGTVIVPDNISYGYDLDNSATYPDFSACTTPCVVIDYGPGRSFSGFPTAYDGANIRKFYFTPDTTATVTFTAAPAGGATSATLTANWALTTGPWRTVFSNGDVRYVTYTNGATTATWTGGLSGAATSSATYSNTAQHFGNTEFINGAWNPGLFIVNTSFLPAPGSSTRTATDNRRCQVSFGNDGLEWWKIGQGTAIGPNVTDEDLSNFALQKVSQSGDTIGNFVPFVWQRKTGNASFGSGGGVPVTSYDFWSVSSGFDQMMIENSWDVQSRMFLRSSAGSTSDGGIGIDSSGATGGNLFLWFRSSGHALDIDRVSRRVSFATSYVPSHTAVSYSASVTYSASDSNYFTLTVTNTSAFTINSPTNLVTNGTHWLTIRNASGGAMGAITWNAVFKQAFTAPANGFSRTIQFRYDGTNLIMVGLTPADVPN